MLLAYAAVMLSGSIAAFLFLTMGALWFADSLLWCKDALSGQGGRQEAILTRWQLDRGQVRIHRTKPVKRIEEIRLHWLSWSCYISCTRDLRSARVRPNVN